MQTPTRPRRIRNPRSLRKDGLLIPEFSPIRSAPPTPVEPEFDESYDWMSPGFVALLIITVMTVLILIWPQTQTTTVPPVVQSPPTVIQPATQQPQITSNIPEAVPPPVVQNPPIVIQPVTQPPQVPEKVVPPQIPKTFPTVVKDPPQVISTPIQQQPDPIKDPKESIEYLAKYVIVEIKSFILWSGVAFSSIFFRSIFRKSILPNKSKASTYF